jgi:hypothetical protein
MSIDEGRGPTLGVIGGTLAHGIVGLFIGSIILSPAWGTHRGLDSQLLRRPGGRSGRQTLT